MALRLLTLTALAATAIAKTDLAGCTYVDGVYTPPGRTDIQPYATRTYYVPDTGEICEILDCGGGRAPPKTDVPGCGNYKGTDTYSPKFMPSSTTAEEAPEETGDADEGEDEDVSGSEALTTPPPTRSGAAPEESGSDEGSGEEGSDEEGSGEEGSDEGAESGNDTDSGAVMMGASLGGVVAVAAALGLF